MALLILPFSSAVIIIIEEPFHSSSVAVRYPGAPGVVIHPGDPMAQITTTKDRQPADTLRQWQPHMAERRDGPLRPGWQRRSLHARLRDLSTWHIRQVLGAGEARSQVEATAKDRGRHEPSSGGGSNGSSAQPSRSGWPYSRMLTASRRSVSCRNSWACRWITSWAAFRPFTSAVLPRASSSCSSSDRRR